MKFDITAPDDALRPALQAEDRRQDQAASARSAAWRNWRCSSA